MIGESIGNYRVLRQIGEGGMGEVYLAEQSRVGTKVVVKVLSPQVSAMTGQVDRFFNEARAVNKIKNPGIVQIFDVGFTSSGRAYLLMELLEGETLSKRVERGRMSYAAVCETARQVAGVLAATHAAGITHRDLKPDNVFLVPDHELAGGERVKVLDFGIAKLTGTLIGGPQTFGSMGTPAYMSPEQWGDASKVDGRADIYSLGCMVFEMACGQPPFVVTTLAEACAKHCMEQPPPARSIDPRLPPELDALLARMLAKAPADRPQTMQELVAVFAQLAAPLPASSRPLAVAASPPVMTAQPAPVHAAFSSTTLGGAAGSSMPIQQRRGRTWLVAALIAGVAGIAVVVAIAAGGGGTPRDQVAAGRPSDAATVTALAIDAGALAPIDASAPPSVVAADVAKAIGSARALLEARRWSDAITETRIALALEPSSGGAQALAEQAKRELDNEVAFLTFTRAADAKKYEQAVAAFDKITTDSVYRNEALDTYEQLHESFITSQVAAGKRLARQNQCADLDKLAAASGAVFLDARAELERIPCRREQVAAAPAPGASIGSAPAPSPAPAPASPPPPPPTPRPKSASELLAEAEAAASANQWGRALALAEETLRVPGLDTTVSYEARVLAGLAACNTKNATKARIYVRDARDRQFQIEETCRMRGIDITD